MATYRPITNGGFTPGESGFEESGGLRVGLEFEITSVATPIWLTQIRWYQPSGGTVSTTARLAALFTVTGTSQVTTEVSASPVGGGWQTLTLAEPYELAAVKYKAVVVHPGGGYPATSGFFTSGGPMATSYNDGPVRILNGASSTGGQMTFDGGTTMGYPTSTSANSNYWVDVTVTTDPGGGDGTPTPGTWSRSLTMG